MLATFKWNVQTCNVKFVFDWCQKFVCNGVSMMPKSVIGLIRWERHSLFIRKKPDVTAGRMPRNI